MKALNSYRNLKKANEILTLEKMALKQNKEIIVARTSEYAKARKSVLQNANLKINWDKQGKHIKDHRNFECKKNPSVLEHKDPERLIKNFAGTGIKDNEIISGSPGYKEVVNFKEFIGYAVVKETGEQIPTTWGRIHYAKDGVHIVPTKPRESL